MAHPFNGLWFNAPAQVGEHQRKAHHGLPRESRVYGRIAVTMRALGLSPENAAADKKMVGERCTRWCGSCGVKPPR